MELQSNTGLKAAAEKLKIEPFRIGGKTNIRDAPIFEIENDAAENKRRKRRLVELKNMLNQEEKKGITGETATVDVDRRESRDMDVLEVNAENDSSIEKDVEEIAEPVAEEVAEEVVQVAEEVLVAQEGKSGEAKHHKKHKKHEKKKRRKEKTDEDARGKRHKKQHRAKRSRSKNRSASPSSSPPRRHHSGSDRRKSRDRSRNRSREINRSRNDASDTEWRYSPSRFDSRHHPHHGGRFPPGDFTQRRGRDQSPQEEFAQQRTLSRSRSPKPEKKPRSPRKKSPRAKSPRAKSPRAKSPRAKSPRVKSPRVKSPKAKSPGAKSPEAKSPEAKSLMETSPRAKSPRAKSPRAKSPRAKSPRAKSSVDTSHRVKSTRKKSPRRKSAAKKSTSKSPSTSTLQGMSDGEIVSSDVKTRVQPSGNGLSEVPSRSSTDSVIIIEPSVMSSKKSPRKSPHKSPSKSPRIVAKDPSPTSNVIVPYVVDDDEEEEEEVSKPANEELESKPIPHVDEDKVYVGITNESTAVKKKSKSKKKTKKRAEERKKKKKTATGPVIADVGRNSDDELEDLLFTKTNKETKFEDVFHDSELLSAKHNLRIAVVDVQPKPARRGELLKDQYPIRQEITPVQIPPVQKAPVKIAPVKIAPVEIPPMELSLVEILPMEIPPVEVPLVEIPSAIIAPVEIPPVEISPVAISPVTISPVAISPVEILAVVSPNMSSEAYKPEEPTDESTNNFAPLQPPPQPPFLPGFFPSIPFLTEKQQQEVDEVPQPLTKNDVDDEAYSPVEDIAMGSDLNSSLGRRSPVHLSDISTKESSVDNAVGVITPAEKIEDFLGRMPGSFAQPEVSEVVDMDMSSPTNGLNATFQSSEDDDDIIEQLHKEFVRSQNKAANAPEVALNNSGIWASDAYEPVIRTPSPTTEDRIVLAFKAQAKKRRAKKHKVRKEKEPLAKEKKDIEEALNRVHRQARVEDEMKHVLKGYYKNKDITKEEYKMILRKAVPQVANSTHGIDPERVRSLAKKYVAKYKGIRMRGTGTLDRSLAEREAYSPPLSQDIVFAFSP